MLPPRNVFLGSETLTRHLGWREVNPALTRTSCISLFMTVVQHLLQIFACSSKQLKTRKTFVIVYLAAPLRSFTIVLALDSKTDAVLTQRGWREILCHGSKWAPFVVVTRFFCFHLVSHHKSAASSLESFRSFHHHPSRHNHRMRISHFEVTRCDSFWISVFFYAVLESAWQVSTLRTVKRPHVYLFLPTALLASGGSFCSLPRV